MHTNKASKLQFIMDNDSFNREKTEEVLRRQDLSELEHQFKQLVERSNLIRQLFNPPAGRISGCNA